MAVLVSHRCDCIVICISCLGTVVRRERYFAARAKAIKEEEEYQSTQNNRHTMRSGWKKTGSLKGGAPPDKPQYVDNKEEEFESDTESKSQTGPSRSKGKSIREKGQGKRSIVPVSDHEDSSDEERCRRRKVRDDRRQLMITSSKKEVFQPNEEDLSILRDFVFFTTQNSSKYKNHKHSVPSDVLVKLKRGDILTGKEKMYQSNTCRIYRDALLKFREMLQDNLNQTAPQFLEGGVLHFSNFTDFGSSHWVKPNFNIVDVIEKSNASALSKIHMVRAYNSLLKILEKKVNSENGKQTLLSNIPVDNNLTGFALQKAKYEANKEAEEKCENITKLIGKVLNQIKQSGFAKDLTEDVEEKHAMKANFEQNVLGHNLPEANKCIKTYMESDDVKKTEEELSSVYHDREKQVTSTQLYKFTHHILISLYGKAGYRTEALLNMTQRDYITRKPNNSGDGECVEVKWSKSASKPIYIFLDKKDDKILKYYDSIRERYVKSKNIQHGLHNHFFINKNGNPVTAVDMKTLISKIQEKKITPYTFRHMFSNTTVNSGDDKVIEGECFAAGHSKVVAEKYYSEKSTERDKAKYATDFFREQIGLREVDSTSDEEEFEEDKQRQLELQQEEAKEQIDKYKETDAHYAISKDRTINDETRLAIVKICIADAMGKLGGPLTNKGSLTDILLKSRTKSVHNTLVTLMRVLDKAPKLLDERLELQNQLLKWCTVADVGESNIRDIEAQWVYSVVNSLYKMGRSTNLKSNTLLFELANLKRITMEDVYPHNNILTGLINNVCSKIGSDRINEKSKEDYEVEAEQSKSNEKRHYSPSSPENNSSLFTSDKKAKRASIEESTTIVISTDSDSSIKGASKDEKPMTIVISSDSD